MRQDAGGYSNRNNNRGKSMLLLVSRRGRMRKLWWDEAKTGTFRKPKPRRPPLLDPSLSALGLYFKMVVSAAFLHLHRRLRRRRLY